MVNLKLGTENMLPKILNTLATLLELAALGLDFLGTTPDPAYIKTHYFPLLTEVMLYGTVVFISRTLGSIISPLLKMIDAALENLTTTHQIQEYDGLKRRNITQDVAAIVHKWINEEGKKGLRYLYRENAVLATAVFPYRCLHLPRTISTQNSYTTCEEDIHCTTQSPVPRVLQKLATLDIPSKDGAFRRLFNISRPENDPIQRFGVPGDFVPLNLGAIDTFDAVLEPGSLHGRKISTSSTEVGTPGEILPAEASFRFACSSKRGAILTLETQMIREEAVQSLPLEIYVMQFCRSWHAFIKRLGIHITFGDLMLITECSKTAAWERQWMYAGKYGKSGLSQCVIAW
ncbi:hypothetical protein BDZ94DRAFT_1239516 [Collybia nuda]|uniref:Uncharacterized protein n=1 Tax=Collybia nuda TaxID=64659 RepID=A0A9P6CB30_9AGAR|nr:hypothetical protein BDZ94DRAFT_1239516 [Collybia nuda]